MYSELKTNRIFDLEKTIAGGLFAGAEYPWEILDKIGGFILSLGEKLPKDEYEKAGEGIWISVSAKIAPTASISAPCIIDSGAELRHCAFIRGGAVIGKNAVVGNSVEVKNSVIFDGAQIPHFNYVGDSVLGFKAHLGAGAVTSNVKSDKTPVCVKAPNAVIETGRKKLGAMLGDGAEIGCNAVLCPGTVIGRESRIYPALCVRGVIPPRHIVKADSIVPIECF